MFFDSHAHLGDESLFDDAARIIERAWASDVEAIVNIATTPLSLKRGLQLQSQFKNIYLAAATPPHHAEDGFNDLPLIEEAAKDGKLVAIGECGLDYFHHEATKELQAKVFIDHIELAKRVNLPLVIHCRSAFDDFFKIIDTHFLNGKGVLHCFTGTLQEAKSLIERGWMISFSGIITFKKSTDLQEIVKQIPLDHLLIETDAPYLAPVPYRGKLNEPAFIAHTAQCIAALRGISLQEVAKATSENAHRLFL